MELGHEGHLYGHVILSVFNALVFTLYFLVQNFGLCNSFPFFFLQTLLYHKIIQIPNNVLWDRQYSTKYFIIHD